MRVQVLCCRSLDARRQTRQIRPAGVFLAGLLIGSGPLGCDATHESKPAKRIATAPSNGFAGDVAWRGFDEGLAESRERSVPVMLVVHTSWCPRCKSLKGEFSDSELEALSESFVMVNVDQDFESRAKAIAPDGDYVPRIVFLSPDGTPSTSIVNERSPRFRHFYTGRADLKRSMRHALKTLGDDLRHS